MAKQTFYEGQKAVNDETGQTLMYSKGRWSPEESIAPVSADAPAAALTPGSESRTRVALGLGPAVEAQKRMYAAEGWKPDAPNPLDRRGHNPFSKDWHARVLEAVPWDGGAAARWAGGQDYQDYEQAAKTFESAFLPILSGAAVTPSEAQRMMRAAVPQMNDTPAILAQKAKQRAQMINAAADLAGRPRPFPKNGTIDMGGGSSRRDQINNSLKARSAASRAEPIIGLDGMPIR